MWFRFGIPFHLWAFRGGSAVQNPPATQETWRMEMQVRSLGREDPLEKEMATHSSILVWEIPWESRRGTWEATVHEVAKESDTMEQLNNKQ